MTELTPSTMPIEREFDLGDFEVQYMKSETGIWVWIAWDCQNPTLGKLALARGLSLTRDAAKQSAAQAVLDHVAEAMSPGAVETWMEDRLAFAKRESEQVPFGFAVVGSIVGSARQEREDDHGPEESPTRVMHYSDLGQDRLRTRTSAQRAVQMARVIEDDPVAHADAHHQLLRELDAVGHRLRGICMLLGLEP